MSELVIAFVSGGCALVGGLGGVGLTSHFAARADERRQRDEDDRRWQRDRRGTYGAYLGLATSMLREVDAVAVFLNYDEAGPPESSDEEIIVEGLQAYYERWDDEVQPALGEVQLLASSEVADLADRVSGALMLLGGEVEQRAPFTLYYPMWFQACDLLSVLRNAMRNELGVAERVEDTIPRDDNWPWLADRPSRETYAQGHGIHDRNTNTATGCND